MSTWDDSHQGHNPRIWHGWPPPEWSLEFSNRNNSSSAAITQHFSSFYSFLNPAMNDGTDRHFSTELLLSVLWESLSPSRGELAATEPTQSKSALEKVVAGQGAAVKDVSSFQQRLSSLNGFGCAAEDFLSSSGDGRISGLPLDPVRTKDQRWLVS